ncbi:MAG: GntR family transcriptional regulator [Rhodobacteraceae bacterium]|nr:GntR family transcriptional regulator [Paracoccaceae bacterium]
MKAEIERERVTSALQQDIVFGRLKPRERLVEQEIMDRLDTRRHVVRAAFEALENKGLVERRANRGAMVRDLTPKEIEELYYMRELLHRAAAESTPLPLAVEVLEELSHIQAAHEAAIENGDLQEVFLQNERFHTVLNHACGNSVLEEALNLYNERTNLIRSFAFRSLDGLRRSADQHRQILKAGSRTDRSGYAEAILRHILGARDSYLKESL